MGYVRISFGVIAWVVVSGVGIGCQQTKEMAGNTLTGAMNGAKKVGETVVEHVGPDAWPGTAHPASAQIAAVPPVAPSTFVQASGVPGQPSAYNLPTAPNAAATAHVNASIPKPTATLNKGRREDAAPGQYRAYCSDFDGVARQQETDLWCWAAGIEMIYKYRGQTTSQTEIVKSIFGTAKSNDPDSAPVKAALQWEVMAALCPDEAKSVTGRPITALTTGLWNQIASGRKGRVEIKFDLSKAVSGLHDSFVFDSTDLVQSVSSGSPALMSLIHKSDPNKAHMYVVYSVTYKPTIDVAGTAVKGGLASLTGDRKALRDTTAAGPRAGCEVSEIRAINPWTGKSETMLASDFQPRVAYMMSETSVRRAYGELSGVAKVSR